MEGFFQAAAGILAAVVVWIVLSRQSKEYALLLSICACCLALAVTVQFLEPVLELVEQLRTLGDLQPEWLGVMLKAVGIGLVVEIGGLVCSDAGNGAMAKTLQALGTAAVLWLSVPLMNSLIELLQQILGGL